MTKWTTAALDKISAIAKVKATPAMLHSTLGRHGARAVRTAVLSELAYKHWQLLTDNVTKGDKKIFNPPTFPKGEIEGVGFHEAPRGTLSHGVVIDDGKIKNYQAVVPTTWNASPRDIKGVPGPYEAALLKNPIARHPASAGSVADDPFLRSVHGVRGSHVRSEWKESGAGEGAVVTREAEILRPAERGEGAAERRMRGVAFVKCCDPYRPGKEWRR